jgi:acyl-CoA thioesterase-1
MDAGMNHALITRRTLLAHCTVAVALAAGVGAGPAAAQGKAASGKAAREPVVLVVGDSLSAEYGLARGTGWVALLEQRLEKERVAARVVNASISGDTTSGGRSRLPALLKQHQPTHVVIELGGNDALRGLPLSMTRDNLTAMAKAAREAGAHVLVLGMQLPPNYGRKYGEEFAAVFATVAKSENTALVPFFLKGVADVPNAEALFQADRIHPREQAHPTLLNNVWPVLAPMLKAR